MRLDRKDAIKELINSNEIETQDELQKLLTERGFKVTQSTVSRDIKQLNILKTVNENGKYVYTTAIKNITSESDKKRFNNIFSYSVINVDYALNNVVIKCHTGMAQGACVALDGLFTDMILGSLAGEDTIIVVTRSVEDAHELTTKLKRLI